jgi:hypothetical protein
MSDIREMTTQELEAAAGGNPIVLGVVGFIAAQMAQKVSDEVGLTDAIDFKKMESYVRSKQRPA